MTRRFTSVKELAGEINNTLHADFDFPIAITGLTGTGKSNLCDQLAMEIAKLNNHTYNREVSLCFSRQAMEENIKTLAPRYSLVSGDEMINSMYKRDFQNKAQNNLIKLFNMCRFRNLSIAFVIPRYWSLDKEVRQNYIKMWISVSKRGKATIFVPDIEDVFTDDVWHRLENSKLIQKGKIHNSINYAGEIEFGDFKPADKAKYLEIKERKSLKSVGR